MSARPAPFVLIADDFAMSAGVTMGIAELAEAGLLSGTSAIVTLPRWHEDAARLKVLRPRLSAGLHLSLTLGRPLGAMPRLCPDGRFPSLQVLVAKALAGAIDVHEIAAETERQIDAFGRLIGSLPDHLDGHAHVHALPKVRRGVLNALAAADSGRRVVVRDPADRITTIQRRGLEIKKATMVALFARDFGTEVRRAGFTANTSFAGYSAFRPGSDYAQELAAAVKVPSARHLVMCHPGYPDQELALLDPVTERRREELAALRRSDWLRAALIRPERGPAAGPVFWRDRAVQE